MNLHNLSCTLLLYHERHSYSYSYLDLFQLYTKIQIYNLLMKITQPTSMAASLQMNSQNIYVLNVGLGGGVNYQFYFVHLLIKTCIYF